jgi:hypothetical protein
MRYSIREKNDESVSKTTQKIFQVLPA